MGVKILGCENSERERLTRLLIGDFSNTKIFTPLNFHTFFNLAKGRYRLEHCVVRRPPPSRRLAFQKSVSANEEKWVWKF